MNTLNRSDISASLSLSSVTSRLVLNTRDANAVTIYADREFGSSWGTFVLSVKRLAALAPAAVDFDTPRTIPAGGGVVTIGPSEMLGVERIELAWSSGATEASGTTARIIATIETRNGPETPGQTAAAPSIGVRQLTLGDPMSDSPDPGGES